MELGERTAKMEKSETAKSKVYESEARTYKKDQLHSIGLSKQRASEYEQLVKPENRPIVEHYLEKAETTGGNLYGKVTFI